MEFTYKTLKEVSEMSIDEQSVYMTAKATFEAAQNDARLKSAIEEAQKNNVSKEDLEAFKKELGENQKALEQTILQIKNLTQKGGKVEEKTLVDEVKALKGNITKLAKGTDNSEIELKAVTNRASITNSTSAVLIEGIGQLGVKRRSLYDALRKITIADGDNQGRIRYIDWDEDTTVRAAAMVAEGNPFPESTAKFAQYTLDLKKIGDTLPVTEEFLEDEVTLSNELEMFLDTNVNTLIDAQLINGTGGANLTGLLTSVPAYTPVASGIADANIYDLVKKVSTDITFNRGSKYMPNGVVANANVLDQLWLHKDANDNYLFRDLVRVGSIELIEDNNMPNNQLVVGDMRYARLYEKAGVVLSKGFVDAQFAEDLITLKARKRLLFLIRTVDKTGFRKVTDVNGALAVLATASGS